jgi:hypothetical protein
VSKDPILDAAEELVEKWAAARAQVGGATPEEAMLMVTPREVVDLVADVMRREGNIVPGDRVVHLVGTVGTARSFSDADGIVVVHWDGNGPDHVARVPRAHLSRLHT